MKLIRKAAGSYVYRDATIERALHPGRLGAWVVHFLNPQPRADRLFEDTYHHTLAEACQHVDGCERILWAEKLAVTNLDDLLGKS